MRSNVRRLSVFMVAAATAILIAGGIALAAVIEGGVGNNTLTGTPVTDTINGNAGNDTVYGLEGNDQVDGGDGADRLYGGDESQFYLGNDYILGRNGSDRIFGGPGADRLHGGSSNDVISEGPPDDESADTITGGPEDDRIYAASGVEEVVDVIRCDAGRDEVWADASDNVAADCEVVNRQPSVASITFQRPVQTETVTQMAGTYDSQISELESEFSIAGEFNLQGATNPTQTDPLQLQQALEESRLGYYEDTAQDIEELPTEMRADMEPQYDAMRAALSRNDAGTPTVTEVTLTGELPELRTLATESSTVTEGGEAVIESVQVTDTTEVPQGVDPSEFSGPNEPIADPSLGVSDGPEADPLQPPMNADGTPNLEARSTWWPNQGVSIVRNSWRQQYQGQRYSGQWFSWDNNRLGHGDGYEHSLNIKFDPDRKSYLNGSVIKDGNCKPKNAHWFTNYPKDANTYIDDNLQPTIFNVNRCDQRFRTFTIGITNASVIRDGVPYHTYIRVPKGRVNTDAASLEAGLTSKYNNFGRCTPFHPPTRNFCWFTDASRILIDPQGANSPVDLYRIPHPTDPPRRYWTEWAFAD